jgi:hypothetical protein
MTGFIFHLYFDSKTFASQCEVKIAVFIVLLINANFATYYFNYYNVEFMIPQGSQYHAVVHQCVLYHGNLNIKLGS